MSTWVDLDDESVELAHEIANRLGCTRARVIKMALALLAVDLGLKFELPRKEKDHAE